MTAFQNITEAVRAARSNSLTDARLQCGAKGCLRSRGVFIRGNLPENSIYGEADSIMWDGSLKGLLKEIRDAYSAGATNLSICGGHDWAESPAAFMHGEYDPWVSEWEVLIEDHYAVD